jgi:hypothetical protein
MEAKNFYYKEWQRKLIAVVGIFFISLSVLILNPLSWRGSEQLWLYPVMALILYLCLLSAWDRYNFSQPLKVTPEGIEGPIFTSRGFFFSKFHRAFIPWSSITTIEEVESQEKTGAIPSSEYGTAMGLVSEYGELIVFPQIKEHSELVKLIESSVCIK